MSRKWDPEGVHSDDPDDLEVGALAYSKTVTADDFPRGGTVVGLNLDDDDSVLSVWVLQQSPGLLHTWELNRSDIDMETVQWSGNNARIAAEIINKWLGSKSAPRDQHVKLMWQRRALDLAEAGTGSMLPKTELRYRRHRAAKAAS